MPNPKNAIILIPGIQGTKLQNVNAADFKVIWSGIKKFFSNIHELKLRKDGRVDAQREFVIERADIENMAYSEIVNYLRNQGYKVFIFGYDWRKSNKDTAEQLDAFIEGLRYKLNRKKFNFLTHSMGCLVLSAYFKMKTEKEIDGVVNRAVFTVPPFLGSVEAAFNLLVGKSKLFNSSDDFRKIARTFPAIYELLPVYDGAYSFEDAAQGQQFDPYNFDTYWQQVKNATRSDTLKKQDLIRHRLKELGKIRSQNHLICDMGAFGKEVRDKLLVLAGSNERTMHKIKVCKESPMPHIINFFKFENNDNRLSKEGDGTVHLDSAKPFSKKILTLKARSKKLETWANSSFIMNDWHSFFLNNGRVQNVITRFFDDNKEKKGNWYESPGGGISKM